MTIDKIEKIFMLGDLHLGVRNNSVVWKDDMIDFVEWFMLEIDNRGFNPETDILMLSGDIFHSREYLNVMIMHNVIGLFEKLTAKFKRGVYAILGNHDQYYKRNADVHTLKFMEHLFDNFHIFSNAEKFEINGKINFLMLPWHDDIPVLDKAIQDNDDCDYLFCHLDIAGFKYNKVTRVDKGIAIESLAGYKRIYAGHLHHKQESSNVLYLGSPYQMDLGDIETSRGYYIVNIEESGLREEFYENTRSPRFISCTFDELMEMTFTEAAKVLDRNYVSIHIPTSAARGFSFNTFMDVAKDNKINARRIEFTQYDDSYDIDDKKFEATADFNMAIAAKAFLETRKYTHSETENILSYFNQLYVLAKNNDKDNTK